MTCRRTFALLAAAATVGAVGCQARLGNGGGGGAIDAPASSIDARAVDARMIDAPIDARPCTGGNASGVAPDGSCLLFISSPLTYAAAKLACMNMNAHLAYLKSAPLDTFARTLIGTADTWIGGNDLVTEMTFLWEDGTAFQFTNWSTDEPNNANGNFEEDCAIIAAASGRNWDDRPCDTSQVATSGSFAYLCQF